MDCVERSSLMMEIEGYAIFLKSGFACFDKAPE